MTLFSTTLALMRDTILTLSMKYSAMTHNDCQFSITLNVQL